jgi:hypothetical protein
MVSFILPGNSASTGYEVANSLRFDDGSSDSLTMTPSGSPTNADKNTLSMWVKLGVLGINRSPIFANSNAGGVNFRTDDKIDFYNAGGSLRTTQVFRDISAWYHLVFTTDTTDGTADDRLKIYVNGVQITSFASRSNPSQNTNSNLGSANEHRIGANNDPANFFDGYMAEVVFIDGQALDPTSFGEFDEDSNIWKPIDVSGLTFGNNGFYLDFENSGSLGADVSGNGNNFTVNNLTSIDQTTDTCTNNFATLNPLDNSQAVSFSIAQGNLELNDIGSGDNDHGLRATMGVLSGKWYYEQKQHETSGTIGIAGSDTRLVFDFENQTSAFHRLISSNGTGSSLVYWSNGNFVNNSALQGYGAGDIIGVALDMDNGKLFFSINGVFKGFDNNTADPVNGTNANFTDIPTDGTGGFAMPYIGKRGTGSPQASINFGNPSFSISSGNSDGNGYGNFEYSVPSGYYALNSKNLAEYG